MRRLQRFEIFHQILLLVRAEVELQPTACLEVVDADLLGRVKVVSALLLA